MRKLLLTPLLIATVICGCKQNDNTYVPISADVKSWVNWKTGSYWIMQDSSTHEIDSFAVTKYQSGTFHGSYNRDNETLDIEIREIPVSATNSKVATWYISIGRTGNTNDVQIGSYGYDTTQSPAGTSNALWDADHKDNITIKNVTYSDVQYVNTLEVNPDTSNFLIFCLLKSDGFAYIKMNHGAYWHTWNIINKKIII